MIFYENPEKTAFTLLRVVGDDSTEDPIVRLHRGVQWMNRTRSISDQVRVQVETIISNNTVTWKGLG